MGRGEASPATSPQLFAHPWRAPSLARLLSRFFISPPGKGKKTAAKQAVAAPAAMPAGEAAAAREAAANLACSTPSVVLPCCFSRSAFLFARP